MNADKDPLCLHSSRQAKITYLAEQRHTHRAFVSIFICHNKTHFQPKLAETTHKKNQKLFSVSNKYENSKKCEKT